MQLITLHELSKPFKLPTNRSNAMEIEVPICKEDIKIDLQLDTKALCRRGIETNSHRDGVNEDTEEDYPLSVLELRRIHSEAARPEDITHSLHLREI